MISAESTWFLLSGTSCYMIVLLYDIKFRIILFDMIEPLPCILFFTVNFLVSTQKSKVSNFQIFQTFKFCSWTSTLTTEVAKMISHFLLWYIHVLFLSLERRFCLNWFLLVSYFFTRHFSFDSGARTCNMNEIDSIVFICLVYLFILPTNSINQINTYMYY